jgi:hypothetical protein
LYSVEFVEAEREAYVPRSGSKRQSVGVEIYNYWDWKKSG